MADFVQKPAASTAASNHQDKKDLFKNVPELIEEKKKDQEGNYHVVNKYVKGALLGKGGFAQVYLSTNITNKGKYALKIVAKSSLQKPRARVKLQTEIKIHRSLNHPNIVGFERFFEDRDYAYLLLGLCENNSMSDLLNARKTITEAETKFYLAQLLEAISYIHRNLVIHRDLKVGNIFMDKYMNVKVGDFGLAAKLENPQERRMTVCGTPNYIAPELLSNESKKGHSFEVDIWSTGVVMYTLLVGKPPYQSKDVKSTYKRILANVYSYPDNIQVSAEAKHMISRMLVVQPSARATVEELLTHPFLKQAPPVSVKENEKIKEKNGTPAAIPEGKNIPISYPTEKITSSEKENERNRVSTAPPIGTVEKIHKMLNESYTCSIPVVPPTSSRVNNALWVVRYIDYTSKYGLGFLFNNGSAGVYFNDSTKIVLSADGNYFQYIERRKENSLGSEHLTQKYAIDHYPSELQKKVTLLKHFRNYLVEEELKNPRSMNHEETADLQALKTAFAKTESPKNAYPSNNLADLEKEPELPFLKKWVKTKHAILFRISNRTVQVIFYDRSEVLLSSEAQVITYVNKTGERSEHALNDIMLAGRVDIAKRLKYTKDIMHRLIQSQTK